MRKPISQRGLQVIASQDAAYYSELSEQLLGAKDQEQLLEALLREDLALFAKVVLGLEIGPHIVTWSDLVSAHSRIGLNAARDHGKCLTGDSLILSSSGRRVRADQWRGGQVLALNTETLSFEAAYAPAAIRRAPEHTQTVVTRTGRRVVVNDEHPFRLWDHWVRADQLRVGDRIAVPYGVSLGLTKKIPGAWLLGLLVGDGSLAGGSFRITKKDIKTVRALRAEVASLGWQMSRSGDAYCVHNDYRGGPLDWLREHGLHGCNAYEKRVPSALFECGDVTIAEFLSGYLDSDGSVNLNGGGSVSFSSVSQELLRDVQHLLMRLSVVSVITPHGGSYRGAPYTAWILSVRGKDILKFAFHVRPRGKRSQALDTLLAMQRSRGPCSGAAIDRFSKEIYALLCKSRHWYAQRGLPRPDKKYEPTRAKLQALACAENNPDLRIYANAKVLWDEVLSVEDAGIQTTWSLTVPGLENYVANDIVNHNSAFFSYAYPIWRTWRQPGCEVYLFSNTLEQAQEFLDIILYGRNNLKGMVDIPLVSRLVPERVGFQRSDPRLRLNRSDARLTNGSRIRVAGYGKAMRGRHPQYVVLDDPINDEDMWSETTRRKNIEYFKSAITNMVPPNGQLIVVGTPFSANDLYGYLRKNRSYVFAKFPGIVRADNGTERALFPFRWTLEQLKGRQREIGSVAFAREILCEPISDEISIFPEHLFPPCYDTTLRLRMSKAEIRAHGLTVYFGVDIARSASVGADYFVIFVVGRDRKGNQYVLDIRRSKGLPFREQLHEIEIAAALYDPTLILIESNAMQQLYSSELRRETDLPVKEFVTLATNKYPLDKGVPGQRLLLENRKLVIPRGDEYSVVVTDIWIQECRQFGYIDGKLQGVGSHDDCVLPGTLVMTTRGLVSIESVVAGDEVLTHNSRWRKVLGTTTRHYVGAVHEICPVGSLPFTVTEEHPIWRALPAALTQNRTNRLSAGEWGWRDAASIRAGRKMEGDWLSYPIPPCPEGAPPVIDLARYIEQHQLPNGGPVWKVEDRLVWWRRDRVLPRYVATADPEWWLLLGLFLAEGSVGGAAGGKHIVQFAFHSRETYLADFVRSAALRFFAAPARVIYPKGTNGMVVSFGSKPAAALFGLLGKSTGKALPWDWMSAPKELRLWLVRGWLLGDGSLGHNFEGNGSHLSAVSISRNLIEQMRITLFQSGLAAHVRPFNTGSINPAWHLGIPAADTDMLLRDLHDTERLRWAAREMRGVGIERRALRVGATEVHLRIRSNIARHYCGPVFNLHVAEDESYSLEGIAVHNCVMGWWIATEASRMGGFGFAFDEAEDDDDDEGSAENWESVMLGEGDDAEDAPLF